MAKNGVSLLGGIILLLAAWQLICLSIPPTFMPTPLSVLNSLIDNWDLHAKNMSTTAIEAFFGILIASLISCIVIIFIGLYPSAEPFIYPCITMLKASPAIAFVPVFMVLVGSGISCKILVSAMISFFPLIVGGIDGLQHTPQRLILTAKTYGASRRSEFLNIKLIYATTGFLTGLKTAAPLSVVGAIVGEYVAGGLPSGIGHFIMSQTAMSAMIEVFAATIVAATLGIFYFGLAYLLSFLFSVRAHVDK